MSTKSTSTTNIADEAAAYASGRVASKAHSVGILTGAQLAGLLAEAYAAGAARSSTARTVAKRMRERKEQLDRALFHYLDNAFIAVGEHGKKDFRLHPMFARDFGDVRARIMKLFLEEEE